mgnify:CR=1 FL=1|tara:strand:- start:287 stop:946 length:660 start_codon:yes stop_codon:yes gene_type:complete
MQEVKDGQPLDWVRPRYLDKEGSAPLLRWQGTTITWRQCKASPEERSGSAIAVESIGAKPWSVVLDCIRGYPRLLLFPPCIASRAGHLFVLTEGEDYAGASHHNHKIHCLSGAGKHCWSLSREILPPVHRVHGGWLLLSFAEPSGHRIPEGLWEVLHVGEEGDIHQSWRIDAPSEVQANATLVPRKNGGFVIQTQAKPGQSPGSDARSIKVAHDLRPMS